MVDILYSLDAFPEGTSRLLYAIISIFTISLFPLSVLGIFKLRLEKRYTSHAVFVAFHMWRVAALILYVLALIIFVLDHIIPDLNNWVSTIKWGNPLEDHGFLHLALTVTVYAGSALFVTVWMVSSLKYLASSFRSS